MATSASQLDAMGLSFGVQGDKIVPHGNYNRRLTLQNSIKATAQSDMPLGENFFNTRQPTNGQAARCNMRNSEKYITEFYNKHIGANTTLTMAMIDSIFHTFKCNFEYFHQDDVDDHSRDVHGAIPSTLKPLNTIEIDTKIPFTLNPAHDIEQVGPEKQGRILNGIFTRCVSRGIIKKSLSNRTADLNENRSSEFMAE